MSSRPRRAQYSRVGAEEEDAGVSRRVQARLERAGRAEEYAVKLHAALWVLAATAALFFSDLFQEVRTSDKIRRVWFNLGLLCFAAATCLVMYMAVYVPRVLKSDLDPAVYSPKMLPATGVISLLSGLFLILGLWPLYGLLTPGLLGLLWIGALMSAHFLPVI